MEELKSSMFLLVLFLVFDRSGYLLISRSFSFRLLLMDSNAYMKYFSHHAEDKIKIIIIII